MAEHTPDLFTRQRRAGVCLHITSLPGDYGIGELGGAAFDFIDRLADMQLSVWQFLPTGPTGYGNSPYQSLSTFAGNEMLIDIGDLINAGLLEKREAARLSGLPATKINFNKLLPAKNAVLERVAQQFSHRATGALKSGLDRFISEHDRPWLHNYALFRVLKSQHGESAWPTWPAKFRAHEAKALRAIEIQAGDQLTRVKIRQFLFYHQWRQLQVHAREKGILLFGDMPIYIALDSADSWASRHLLGLDASGQPELVAGVPPDYFSEDGQLWGNPVYDWNAHAAENYSWWTRRFQHSAKLMDVIRVDHFRGFESFYAVKRGATTARDGKWYKGPGDNLFNVLGESLGRTSVVAENLGIITPQVENLRRRHQMPGMKVLQFEVMRKDFNITEIESDCVCYTGTHDNDTTLGWYRNGAAGGNDKAQRRKMIRDACGGRASTIHLDMIRLAFSSSAALAIAPLQDFIGLGSSARLNTPGIAGSSWRWRASKDHFNSRVADTARQLVADSGRGATR